jgi:hypothetical protein
LCKSARPDKTATVIWKIFQIVLWLAAAAYAVVGVLAIAGVLGSAREADSLRHAYILFGLMFLMIGAMAAGATFLANKWRGLFDRRAFDSLCWASACIVRGVLD